MAKPYTENDVLKNGKIHVDLAIRPSVGGPIYRLVASPVKDGRYDAVVMPGKKENASWDGQWTHDFDLGEGRIQSTGFF